MKQNRTESNTCIVYSFRKWITKMMRNSLGKVFSLSKMVQRNALVCPINIVGWFFFSVVMVFSVNVRTAKFAWNFNGLNGIQSTSRLLRRHTKIGQERKLCFHHRFWSVLYKVKNRFLLFYHLKRREKARAIRSEKWIDEKWNALRLQTEWENEHRKKRIRKERKKRAQKRRAEGNPWSEVETSYWIRYFCFEIWAWDVKRVNFLRRIRFVICMCVFFLRFSASYFISSKGGAYVL